MIEHRLIERMLKVVEAEVARITKEGNANVAFIDIAVDFIQTYADRCHHGKEEDILFRDLAKKGLSPEYKKTMDELIQEHIYGRKTTKELIAARDKYSKGDKKALPDIIRSLTALVEFYPKHIEKEDKHFFLPCMKYFTQQEQDAMLNEFQEFDRKLIHEKYKTLVDKLGHKGI